MRSRNNRELVEYIQKAGIDKDMIGALHMEGYFTAPASRSHHLSCEGGLVEHSVNVTRRLVALTKAFKIRWPSPRSPYIVGLLHDLVKCRCYRRSTNGLAAGVAWEYVQPTYPGHGQCSASMADEMGFDLYYAERVAIMYHMGPYGIDREYTEKEFDTAVAKHGDIVIPTFTADFYAAKVDEDGEDIEVCQIDVKELAKAIKE